MGLGSGAHAGVAGGEAGDGVRGVVLMLSGFGGSLGFDLPDSLPRPSRCSTDVLGSFSGLSGLSALLSRVRTVTGDA